MPQRRRNRAEWEQLVDEFETSYESAPSFARSHQLRVSTFRSWLYRIRREREQPPDHDVAFVEVVPHDVAQGVARSNVVRLELPGGCTLVLDSLPPPAYLAEISHELSE